MLHARLRAAAGAAWTPGELFANGEKGAWYEIKPDYLFQNAAGTTPVTTDGDPVGYVQDLSGNGNNATQSTPSKRPVYRESGGLSWLEFNGSSYSLSTPSINFTTTDEMTVSLSASGQASGSIMALVELSSSATSTNGSFLFAPNNYDGANSIHLYRSHGSSISNANYIYSVAYTSVFTGSSKISTSSCELRKDGVQIASSSTNQGSGNYGNHPIYIGARNNSSLYFSGKLFSMVVRGALTDAAVLAELERYNSDMAGI